MSLDQEKRSQIIKSFRGYCKDEKWGKVNATKALAAHLYPDGSHGPNAKKRSEFLDRWSDRIEDVLYKKSTTLSNFKDAELADYIYSFLLDNIGNELIGINVNLFEKHLGLALSNITNSVPDFCSNEEIIKTFFEIKKSLHNSMVSLKKQGENVYKCNVVFQNRKGYRTRGMKRKFHESTGTHAIYYPEEDLNLVALSGLLYSNNTEFVSLDGLLSDSLKGTVFGIKISNAKYTMPSRAIHPQDISDSSGIGFIRIETSIPYFPKTHTQVESDRVFLAGDLVPYSLNYNEDKLIESDFIKNKLINELKVLCES